MVNYKKKTYYKLRTPPGEMSSRYTRILKNEFEQTILSSVWPIYRMTSIKTQFMNKFR